MTTLKETIGKLNKLYLELSLCNDHFHSMIIVNDIELVIKSYGRECSKASLEKATNGYEIYDTQRRIFAIETKSITNESNIVLL